MSYFIIIFFSLSSLFAAPVEMSLPEFSNKVRAQGTEDKNPSEGCTMEVEASTGKVSNMTCGTGDNKSVDGKVVGKTQGETSDYARDLQNKQGNRR
ncbi:MAG: hypothetical protein AAF203_07895 [Pseudomonadota bacterium]